MPIPKPWRSDEIINEGGQAWVYKVKRTDDNNQYALKLFKNKKHSERFEQEIKLTKSLYGEYPNWFPEIIESGYDRESRPYYVMPFYKGSLEAEIRDGRYTADRPKAIDIAIQLVDILAVLHRSDPPIAHRDLKPDNVLIRDDGALILADLGLAFVGLGLNQTRFTSESEAIGSRHYMAPENAGNNGVPAAQPGDIMVYSWQGANPDGSPKNMDHLAFVVADAPGTQYPEVAEWGQFANYGPADYANNPTSPYVERGWTYSEMNHMFLQDETNQQNMTVYLLHINGGTFVPSY